MVNNYLADENRSDCHICFGYSDKWSADADIDLYK